MAVIQLLAWVIRFEPKSNNKIELAASPTIVAGVRYSSTVQHSTAQHSAVQYSTVQYSTAQYSTAQYSTVRSFTERDAEPHHMPTSPN